MTRIPDTAAQAFSSAWAGDGRDGGKIEALRALLEQSAEGFVYLATPYTKFPGGRDEAFQLAALYAGRLLELGLPVYCPIAHSHPIARAAGIDETDHEIWMRADRPFVTAAFAIVVLTMDGWRESRGVAHEIAAFVGANKPVIYLDPALISHEPSHD